MGDQHGWAEELAIGPVKLEIVPEDDPCGVLVSGTGDGGGPWVAYVDVDGDGIFETAGPTLSWGGTYWARGRVVFDAESTVAKRGTIATLFGRYVDANRLGPDCPDVAFRVVRLTPKRDERGGERTGGHGP